MLISTILTFTTPKANTLPADLGRALYAEVLRQIGLRDADLAQAIHAWNGPVPLTASSLLGARRQGNHLQVTTNTSYSMRVTGLWEPVSHLLQSFLLDQPEEVWTIHRHPFHLVEATCDRDRHSWAGVDHYDELAAAHLLQSTEPSRQITLHFNSPTAFKSNRMQVPVPMPGLVFGSLVDRWNQYSSVKLDEAMRSYGEETVAISRYELNSVPVIHKNGAMRIGGVGKVTYTALDGDRYWFAAMNMLADFALYSGVGVQTTTGMGQVRRIS